MEDLFLAIMRRIRENMPDIVLIDEDCGQLMFNEDTDSYPITFPCALIGNIEMNWTTKGSIQQGRGSFTVRLAIDCYDDTHLGSGTEEKISDRLRMNTRLCRSLHGYRKDQYMSHFERTKSVDFTLPRNIKVYETTFEFEIADRSMSTPL